MKITKQNLLLLLQNFIYNLSCVKGWLWVDLVICLLAQFEVYLKLLKTPGLKEELETCDVCAGPGNPSRATLTIPNHDVYCGNCPYHTKSKIAETFFGEQVSGYCYYMDRGDFSFAHCTDLLWDGVKECGINDDINEEDYDIEEISLNGPDIIVEEITPIETISEETISTELTSKEPTTEILSEETTVEEVISEEIVSEESTEEQFVKEMTEDTNYKTTRNNYGFNEYPGHVNQ